MTDLPATPFTAHPLASFRTEGEAPRRPWPWPVAYGVVITLLLLGGLLWLFGRSPSVDSPSLSETGASVYVELVGPGADADAEPDASALLASSGVPDGIEVIDVELAATAQTALGDVALVTYSGRDADGAGYACIGIVDRAGTASTCDRRTDDEVLVFWGESAGSTNDLAGAAIVRSVTIFNAPANASSMFVLLDSGDYVGADVVNGASHVGWTGRTDSIDSLFVLDANGHTLHRQQLEPS